jgi:hypothetical protein
VIISVAGKQFTNKGAAVFGSLFISGGHSSDHLPTEESRIGSRNSEPRKDAKTTGSAAATASLTRQTLNCWLAFQADLGRPIALVTSDPTWWTSPGARDLTRGHEPHCGLGCVKYDRIRGSGNGSEASSMFIHVLNGHPDSCACVAVRLNSYSTPSNME